MAYKRTMKKRAYRKKRVTRRPRKTVRRSGGAAVNTASIRENYSVSVPDGSVTFLRNIALANATFDRATAVAAAYQEFKIKYVKLTFRPSADTFTPAAGNVIPQLYYQLDRGNTIPTNATTQTMLDMGCRPVRFDSRNIVRRYAPAVLLGADSPGLAFAASQIKVAPWLSTNAFAGNPGVAWSPSLVDHTGCAFIVVKQNPLTPTLNFNVDIEVVFCFRKPLWSPTGAGVETTQSIIGDTVVITH